MEEVISFLANQQARDNEIYATPPSLPNNRPAGSVSEAPSKTETVADGIAARAKPVIASINDVTVRSDFIFKDYFSNG